MAIRTRKLYAAGLLASLLTQSSEASLDSIEHVLEPLEFLDVSALYDRFSAFIDLFVYTLIFVGVAQVTLEKRFPGRGGAVLRAGMGISLAVAMVIAEQRFGFSLRSFGPFAAGILLLLFGIVIYRLLHYAGMAGFRSGALTYIAVYLAMRGVAPDLFAWLDHNLPLVNAMAFAVLLVSVLLAIVPGHGLAHARHVFEARLHRLREDQPGRRRAREAVGREARFIKHRAKPAASKVVDASGDVLHDLGSIEDSIRRHGAQPEARRTILDRMRSILPKGRNLQASVQNLKDLNARLGRLDRALFSESQRGLLDRMSDQERHLLRKELGDEVGRLGLEKKIAEIEEGIERSNRDVYQDLSSAAGNLVSGRVGEALRAVRQAIASERDARHLAKQIRHLERKLLALTKRDMRIEKKLSPA